MGGKKEIVGNKSLGNQVVELREALTRAGLIATDLEVASNGEVVVPKGSLKFAAAAESVAAADPSDTQQVAASQLRISELYYQNVLDQARHSFRWALAAAMVGLVFFIAAIGVAFTTDKISAALISAFGGAIVEIISGLNFWLYAKTASQLDAFHIRLERMQRFLLANSIARSIDNEDRAEVVSRLVTVISQSTVERSNHSAVTDNSQMPLDHQPDTHGVGASD